MVGFFMVRRQVFASMVLLLIVVFSIGIIVGRSFSNPELSKVDKFIKQSELSTESYLIEQELFSGFEKNCDLAKMRLSGLSQELWRLGKLLGSETARDDLGAEQYDFLKRKFHLMQIKTYNLYYRLRNDCGLVEPVIVFYYGRNDLLSQEQGRILDRLVEDVGVNVFAIEFNYSSELGFLEDYYGINQTPAVIVNFKTARTGLTSYEDLAALVREG